jgi:predicted transcriptional regulator
MTILTVEIDKEKDLSALQEVLSKMGLKYHLEEDDDNWDDVPEGAIEGIKAGLADLEAGRTHTHEYVMAEINKKIDQFRKSDVR